MLTRNRFDDALFIQAGAVNGLAISKALHRAYEAARSESRNTKTTNQDPAVQLILHQLCHLAAIPTKDKDYVNGEWWSWDRATMECIELCQSWHTLVTLKLQDDVRLFVCDYATEWYGTQW
jgi:hypothetical protein